MPSPSSAVPAAPARARPNPRALALSLLALALVPAFYAAFVIRDFSGPIGDHSESFISEYLGWYTARHFILWPIPHIQLFTDDTFYPFGANVALQSFCVERDLLMAALARLGSGPWLQLYFLAGVVLSTGICFALLRREHGDARAALATALMHGFNFYAMQKYPYHYNIAVCHWTVAGIVCDFVIVERALAGRRVSLRLILFRGLLLVLAFGLELGHVLGYSLTSALFAGALLAGRKLRAWRRAGADRAAIRDEVRRALAARLDEARRAPGTIALLLGASALFTWLYGATVYSIVVMTRQYDFRGMAVGTWWSNPLRLLIPYFPFLHPSQQPRFLHVLGDTAEMGIGCGGAGWLMLILAVLGLRQAKRDNRLLPYWPLIIAFLAYALSHPSLPFIRLLPWFAFTRVFSRATLIYSVLFALCAIDVSFDSLVPSRRRAAIAGLVVLGAIELSTVVLIKRGDAAYAPDSRTTAYFERIQREPGEALLDWPFCLLGGNGDIGGLCPYWSRLRGVFALQRFHEKKVVGDYLGRLHPDQIAPFVEAGWDRMFDPDVPDITVADHQTRCFTPDEWRFFREFFERNDFAGLQLATDRLAPGCEAEFYRQFGPPAAETRVAAAGRLVFIPKPAAARALVDRARGRAVRLGLGELQTVELVDAHRPGCLRVRGLSQHEIEGETGRPFRWSLGPETRLDFDSAVARDVTVKFRAWSELSDQSVAVLIDGQPVASWDRIPGHETFEHEARFHVEPGSHALDLRYGRWNGRPGDTFARSDTRKMALRMYSLRIEPR